MCSSQTRFTVIVAAPLTLGLGVLTTHRVVGPLHRFRGFLGELIEGKRPGPCRIRHKDELQDFCALLNEATAPLREQEEAQEDAKVLETTTA